MKDNPNTYNPNFDLWAPGIFNPYSSRIKASGIPQNPGENG